MLHYQLTAALSDYIPALPRWLCVGDCVGRLRSELNGRYGD
jgi:hypothetical protein